MLLFAQTYQTIFEKLDSYSEYVYDYLRPIFVPLRLTLAEYLASLCLLNSPSKLIPEVGVGIF